MSFRLYGIRIIFVISIAIAFILAGLLWRNRDKRGATALVVVTLSLGFWTLCLLLTTVTGAQLTRLSLKFMYIFVGIEPPALLVFVLLYTGRERYVTRRTLAALSIHPILLVLAAFINPMDLFFTGFDMSAVGGAEQQWGPAFWAHSAYAYTLTLVTIILLLELLISSRRSLYRSQAVALVLAVISPLALNAVFLAGSASFDSTPVGMVASAVFFTLALVRYDFVNISPVAREKLIDNVRDGMLVVNTDDQIVETNPAARRLLGAEDELAGSPVETIFADIPALESAYDELTADPDCEEVDQIVSHGELFLQVEATPIDDDRNRHVGWLLLLQDITEQKQRERDLEQQLEKLDQFASLVSHDLRNPINVASGYIEQTKTTGDVTNLDKAEEAIDRMEDIIDDVLALAREGQEVTDPSEVSLAAVAKSGWETVDTGEATLSVADDQTIMADAHRLQRLFENLFRNSVEHGLSENGSEAPSSTDDLTVTVGVADEGPAELTVFVADDGVGLPVEDANRVFEDGYSTGDDGTGLGLAIVEQIASSHDWAVTAGDSPSGGARFDIEGVSRPV
jgi:PAS domain S-box-containing protein